ncbi:MAG: menaquinone biosynthesis protein [Planctomycetes bacterium]|nr:menaquinone biosynthesis protein [Planctomycetota bacterium]
MQRVRLACVQYLNTVPLIEGLEKLEGVELITEAPSRIAALVEAGHADLGLISVIDAARSHGRLTMLPVGMIGCDGHTLTVRLCSDVPMHRIRVVHADIESHTSVALCRVILERVFGVRPGIEPFDLRAGHDWPETILVIGDKAVTLDAPAGRYQHEADLGRSWKDLTGLPFVYATWMCRTDELDTPRVRTAAMVLDRQRRRNATRLGWIVSARASSHGWSREHAGEYLGSVLRYRVGEREREAVARFLDECLALDLLESPSHEWASLAW